MERSGHYDNQQWVIGQFCGILCFIWTKDDSHYNEFWICLDLLLSFILLFKIFLLLLRILNRSALKIEILWNLQGYLESCEGKFSCNQIMLWSLPLRDTENFEGINKYICDMEFQIYHTGVLQIFIMHGNKIR